MQSDNDVARPGRPWVGRVGHPLYKGQVGIRLILGALGNLGVLAQQERLNLIEIRGRTVFGWIGFARK